MSEVTLTSYDEVPYESKPLYSTHPDCLAVAARLRGLAAPHASRCRVLELGCAGGGNLIPLAYALPESTFVGVDLSPRQIADGQQVCDRLGLQNIKLRAASIADIDQSWGTFDYIVCHGVFSWVPPAIQDKILWACRHLLSENGVAYISYNTNPGWRLKSVIRDLMRFHCDRFDDPQTKVQQARSILTFMAKASADIEHPLSRLYAGQAKSLPEEADYYLFHEHLEELNQAFYFREFVAKARAAELEYLGEAWHHTVIDNLPEEVQEGLEAISADLIELEQFVDFLRSRTFRRTLLVHRAAQFVQSPDPSVVEPLFFTALCRPQSEQPDVASDAAEKFVLDDGTTATTNMPVLKAALAELYANWPSAVSFDALRAAVCDKLQIPTEQHAAAAALLAAVLVRGYVRLLVAAHCEPFRFTLSISERPRGSALARLVAERQDAVPNLRHRLVRLSPVERLVLTLADGTRTHCEIGQALQPHLDNPPEGEIDPQLLTTEGREHLAGDILQRLARYCLLEA